MQTDENRDTRTPSDGNVVHDAFLDVDIPFPSNADAMLANVVMNSDTHIDNATFDSVLRVVRQPGFNAPDLTLQSSLDIFRQISNVREEQLFEKQLQLQKSTRKTLFTDFILEQVCDMLKQELVAERRAHRCSEGGIENGKWHGSKAQATLRSMSLVNSEWAHHARRYGGVGHFLFISAMEPTLYKVIRNPVYGRFTRDLTITEPEREVEVPFENSARVGVGIRPFGGFVERNAGPSYPPSRDHRS